MINNLKIRYKFLLLSLLGVISISLFFIFTYHIIDENLSDIEKIFISSKEVEKIQHDIIIPLFELKEKSLFLSIVAEKNIKEAAKKDLIKIVKKLDISFKTLNKEIQKNWSAYKKLIFAQEGKKDFSRFIYYSNGNLEKNSKIGGFLYIEEVKRKEFYLLISKLNKFQDSSLKISYNSYKKTKESLLKKQKITIIVVFILLILTLYFSYIIAKDMILSLEKVKNGLESFFIFSREKSEDYFSIDINIKKDDEFGEIADMINKNILIIKNNIKKDLSLIEDATNVVEDIKAGHYSRRLSKNTNSIELVKLKEVINEMLNNLEEKLLSEIREKVKQEKLLIQQSKLAAMGNMIGNIAHQWRQPLSELNAILMNLEVKKEHADLSDKTFQESLDECNIILTHMSNTITDFQNFFKPSKKKENFSLKAECQNASYIIESSLKYNKISFNIKVEDDCNIFGYPREFSQVILNILSNAKDTLLERKIKNSFINLTLKKGKKYALIKIEDNAGGIKSEHFDKIFEPYFTTKQSTKGTGIGLYMSKIIIEDNMHGYLSFKNSSKGAVFIIKLKI